MTAPAPCGAASIRPPDPTGLPQGDRHREDSALHPDVLAYAEHLVGEVTPRRLRDLQRQYDRGMLQRATREEETPVLVRTMHRRGSVPVDASVGERVAGRVA